jgi:transcriptional regulator with XRE-family HTH domain
MNQIKLGKKVRLLREQRGLTVRAFAWLTGIQNLSRLERGLNKNVSFDTVSRIAKYFKVPMEFFRDEE